MAPSDSSYVPRVVDRQLQRLLGVAGAVVVEGPRACGKTTTALEQAASAARLDRDLSLRQAGQANPMMILEGATPRLVDEWQLVPEIWNGVRAVVDDRQADGQFILTGSATPADDITRHSGAMRIIRMNMRPMTFSERQGTSKISLKNLLDGVEVPASTSSKISLAELVDLICIGGWPAHLGRNVDSAIEANRSYLRMIAGTDLVTLDGVRRDPRKVMALLFSLGRNTATYVTNKTLHADSVEYGERIDAKTISTYLDALARLWVFVEQPAWDGYLRSSAQTRKKPKRHLVDPSLAVAAIGAQPADLLEDTKTLGMLFESAAFRDLYVYGDANGLEVRAYQDRYNNEIDAVLTMGTKWAGIEVKLSQASDVLDKAASKLIHLAAQMPYQPRFLAIVTGPGASYQRKDGVHIISLPELGV